MWPEWFRVLIEARVSCLDLVSNCLFVFEMQVYPGGIHSHIVSTSYTHIIYPHHTPILYIHRLYPHHIPTLDIHIIYPHSIPHSILPHMIAYRCLLVGLQRRGAPTTSFSPCLQEWNSTQKNDSSFSVAPVSGRALSDRGPDEDTRPYDHVHHILHDSIYPRRDG